MVPTDISRDDHERIKLYYEMFPKPVSADVSLPESKTESSFSGLLREIDEILSDPDNRPRLQMHAFFGRAVPDLRSCGLAAIAAFLSGIGSPRRKARVLELVRDALKWCLDAPMDQEFMFHATGSHGLRGILKQGYITPCGDGLTGELSITGVFEKVICVVLKGHPVAEYFPQAYAFLSTQYPRESLALCADGHSELTLFDILHVLFLSREISSRTGTSATLPAGSRSGWRDALRDYRQMDKQEFAVHRYRTEKGEKAFKQAYTHILNTATGEDLVKSLHGLYANRDLSETNLQGAVHNFIIDMELQLVGDLECIRRDPEALYHHVVKEVKRRESLLLCASEQDNEEIRIRKKKTLAELASQYPCILTMTTAGCSIHEARGRPLFERLVHENISAKNIHEIAVPLKWVQKTRQLVQDLGCPQCAVIPIEYFEVRRLISEMTALS